MLENETFELREGARICAMCLRVLLDRISDNLCKTEETKRNFNKYIERHYDAIGKSLIYNSKGLDIDK